MTPENEHQTGEEKRDVRILDWLADRAVRSFRKHQYFTAGGVGYIYTLEAACFNSFAPLKLDHEDLRNVLEEQSVLEEIPVELDPQNATPEEINLKVSAAIIKDQALRMHPELALEELQRSFISPERPASLN